MVDMMPTLKTRNTRICILLGQHDQRMGMLTIQDAERLQVWVLCWDPGYSYTVDICRVLTSGSLEQLHCRHCYKTVVL